MFDWSEKSSRPRQPVGDDRARGEPAAEPAGAAHRADEMDVDADESACCSRPATTRPSTTRSIKYVPEVVVGTCHTAFIALPAGHRLRQHPASGPDARHQHRRGRDRHRRPDRPAEDADDEPLHPVVAVVRDRRARVEGRLPAAHRLAARHRGRTSTPISSSSTATASPPRSRSSTRPTSSRNDVDADLGVYVQDTWTRGRLTLNPGLRFDYFNTSIPEQSVPAGRFVPARRVRRRSRTSRTGRTSRPASASSYDLFGNGTDRDQGQSGRLRAVTGHRLCRELQPDGDLDRHRGRGTI